MTLLRVKNQHHIYPRIKLRIGIKCIILLNQSCSYMIINNYKIFPIISPDKS